MSQTMQNTINKLASQPAETQRVADRWQRYLDELATEQHAGFAGIPSRLYEGATR